MGVLISVFMIEMVSEAMIKNLYYVLVSGYPLYSLRDHAFLALASWLSKEVTEWK